MLTLKLAWRNIWRNKRRTLITTTSIIIAVLLSSVMRSMQEGQYKDMIESTVGTFSGYIQVHAKGYWDEKTLDNSFQATDSLMKKLQTPEEVSGVVPRIESFALGAGKQQSRPVMVMGIDIETEQLLSKPKERLQKGSYFKSNSEQSVLVGHKVLQRLNMQVGDSLVLLGQGFRGMSATGLYPIKGTLEFPNPEMNKNLVMLPLQTAQHFLAADERLTTAAFTVENPEHIAPLVNQLKSNLTDDYEVMSWREMMPSLVQSIEADRGSGYIILGVLYMVVGFGILGTVLMMVTERTYEFGIMLSVGTPQGKLARILSIEILFIAMLGSAIGILLSLPITWYFHLNPIQLTGDMAVVTESYGLQPIIPFSVEPSIFLSQALVIFIITLSFSLIPVIKASNINPVEAMRS
ncbi:ABC-type transport system, involved in lipoprotein release, permease component [Fodinibius salinus]|uniref:ABC-type transport system, involved in lipoprotein release, permease component n=1 Tax=Fodinibius salinus TaxID=860790 RepID=A0A5D3YFJ2_9BACT|nr:FtsX-like permease family protein [Fodinibius salinus]TYP91985.1 ABC-type transport system, involved in lipoprotein release, permease component [Fodinibius salinus]